MHTLKHIFEEIKLCNIIFEYNIFKTRKYTIYIYF